MAGGGVMFVVNGLGPKKVEAGRGTRVAVVTRGMDLPGIIRRVRLSRRIVSGGLCRVRLIAAARRRLRRLTIAGAASTALFISCLLANANSEAVSATAREKKRTGIVNLVGVQDVPTISGGRMLGYVRCGVCGRLRMGDARRQRRIEPLGSRNLRRCWELVWHHPFGRHTQLRDGL